MYKQIYNVHVHLHSLYLSVVVILSVAPFDFLHVHVLKPLTIAEAVKKQHMQTNKKLCTEISPVFWSTIALVTFCNYMYTRTYM